MQVRLYRCKLSELPAVGGAGGDAASTGESGAALVDPPAVQGWTIATASVSASVFTNLA
jgi:hypothetical protein